MAFYFCVTLLKHTLLALLLIVSLTTKAHAADFDQCKAKVLVDIDRGTIESTYHFDIVYHGPLRGIDPSYRNETLALTVDGCIAACGSGPDLWDAFTVFQILTTWILPSVSLIAQLPWESLNIRKRRNLEALLNWIGAPSASLTTTIFNIYMIKKCHEVARASPPTARMDDAMYILSCINQYQYPGMLPAPRPVGRLENQSLPDRLRRLKKLVMRGTHPKPVDGSSNSEEEPASTVRNRNRALLQGVFRQLKLSAHGPHADQQELQARLAELNATLAYHLRLNRRKGVWPLALNILWFGVSLIISVAVAFADLGDNTTAHSLALGLLLSWIPSLVVMAIIDRNPTNSSRCQELIERWLYNVEQVVEAQRRQGLIRDAANAATQPPQAEGSGAAQPPLPGQNGEAQHGEAQQEAEANELVLWSRALELRQPGVRRRYGIGHFVGQGRYLRYCGVANAALMQYEHAGDDLDSLNLDDPAGFEAELTKRPYSWFIIWVCSEVIVGVSFGMAFMVSFNTPTIGLGCRSGLYSIWYILSSLSWLVLLAIQEPWRWLQLLMLLPNLLAVLSLFVITLSQVLGLLNGCLCKSSTFGSSAFGGYMDFEGSLFYRKAYDVTVFWATAAGIGFLTSFTVIAWAMRRWSKSSPLWRIQENGGPEAGSDISLEWIR
ncbi:hypothetical protein Z517_11417 [Fonsecaea pedrosoi CBS 271.37]|uniref:MARVEL domain-containing protein n=1 Tax=Fonsecaea pedrosoi CBS 271.37 TaxID=1442368 RepID=A0A0D2EJT7_9EURO|nr:uncharacterized protein Z517_11417 [Fonsecaea pedrosoi CBS 271.37]KIW74647.1 hypothetical protein Z517_11417 [Fonsecaea pedrosoi CBS 271.37]